MYVQAELIAVLALFVVVFLLLGRLWGKPMYALTNRRLLAAVGPRRDNMRAVSLTDLAPVQVETITVGRHSIDVLYFRPLRKSHRFTLTDDPVWKSLNSGKTDKWMHSYWHVDVPESVRRLVESARTACAVPSSAQPQPPVSSRRT